ncbi:MAG: hypothetical protein K0R21_165 [Anaerocolumna sp.]|jgi:NAD(P)H-hydrate epimerase|nr:hypothetical protein [Anaerocolumna sp.]
MKAIDDYTIERIGIPSMVLMERASLHVVEQIKLHGDKNSRILAVCGYGNNGGDGIGAARILFCQGYYVKLLMVGEESKATVQTKEQLTIARNLGLSIDSNINFNEYTIIIDAIFGIGLSKPISGVFETIIEEINKNKNKYIVFSVDIPSGLSADTAKPYNIAVKADYTISFGLIKKGMLLYPGYEYTGEIITADIGFPEIAIEAVNPNYFTYDLDDLKRLPIRMSHSNKGTYGKVLIIAGSTDISGACFFSAKAAYRTGAGIVKVVTAHENKGMIQTLLPEALITTYHSNEKLSQDTINKIVQDINWASVVVFGPGVGVNLLSEQLLDMVIQYTEVPLIIDADGINLLAKRVGVVSTLTDDSIIPSILELKEKLPAQTILTPHLLELSRLIKLPLAIIQDDLFHIAEKCTQLNKLIYVIKDDRTIVANEEMRYINLSGNSGMATAGAGDVLTGIIAGLIAQGLPQFEAATLGVYIHGLAGDKAVQIKGNYGVTASDIMEAIADVLMY